MITIDQARDNLDQILRAVRLTREEHQVLGSCLELLYDGAKEAEETRQVQAQLTHDLSQESAGTPKIIPIRPIDSSTDIRNPLRPKCPKTDKTCGIQPYEQTCKDCIVDWTAKE